MKKLLQLGLMIYFLSGTLYVTDNYKNFQQALLLFSFLIIIFVYIFSHKKKSSIFWNDIFHFIFVIFLFLSAVYNHDTKNYFGSICMLMIYIIICCMLSKIKILDPMKIYYSIIYVHIILFIYSIIKCGLSMTKYQGIFGNPNSLGGVAVALFTINLGILASKISDYLLGKDIKLKNIFIDVFCLFFWIFFVIISSSRTSFITVIVLLLFTSIYLFKKIFYSKYKIRVITLKRVFILMFIFTFIINIIYNFTSIKDVIQLSIFNKFEMKSANITDGRSERWIMVLNEINALGHGSKHYKLAPHNTFISLLGQYGIFAVFFYILFLINSLKISLRFIKINNCYNFLPFLSITSFICLSMGESMMLKTNMLLIYFSLSTIQINQLERS